MEEFKKKGYYPAGGRSQTSSAGSIVINPVFSLFTGVKNVNDAINNIYNLLQDTAFEIDENTSTDNIKTIPNDSEKYASIISISGACDVSDGEILNADVSEIISKDADDNIVDSIVINENIRNLPLYGYKVNELPNTLIFSGEYHQNLDIAYIKDLDWRYNGNYFYTLSLTDKVPVYSTNIISNVYEPGSIAEDKKMLIDTSWLRINDSDYSDIESFIAGNADTIVIYERKEAAIFDVSQYIDKTKIEIKNGGTLTFNNDNNLSVENTEHFMVKL